MLSLDFEGWVSRMTWLASRVPGGFVLDETTFQIYEAALASQGWERVCKAMDEVILERSSRDPFPSVSEIRAKLSPESDPTAHAVLLANRISEAVTRYGNNNQDRARDFLGARGWEIVRMAGGWVTICEQLSPKTRTSLIAQWRDLALAFQKSGALPSEPKQITQTGAAPSERLLSFNEVMSQALARRQTDGQA